MPMTEDGIKAALDKYENVILNEIVDGPIRIDHTLVTHDKQQNLSHIYWMVIEMRSMLEKPDYSREKVMRWLGFVQGVLWTHEVMTIEQMKEDNRY